MIVIGDVAQDILIIYFSCVYRPDSKLWYFKEIMWIVSYHWFVFIIQNKLADIFPPKDGKNKT